MAVSPSLQPAFEVSEALRVQLVRMAQHLARGRFDAEDVVHDAITTAFARFRAGARLPVYRLEAFLFICVRNAVNTRFRRLKVQERYLGSLSLEELEVDGTADAPDLPAWRTIVDEELREAMEGLSPRQRAVFEAIIRGERYAAIAAQLGISVGAVAKHAFDARARLRKALERVLARREAFLVTHPPLRLAEG